MNSEDFGDWLTYHTEAYPGFQEWRDNNLDVFPHWEKLMKDVTLARAMEGTDELMKLENQPYFGEHARRVRLLALAQPVAEPRAKFVDGRRVFKCPKCLDSGWVSCLNVRTVLRQAARTDRYRGLFTEGELERFAGTELHYPTFMSAKCDCEQGHQHQQSTAARFNPKIMYDKFEDDPDEETPAKIERAREWVEKLPPQAVKLYLSIFREGGKSRTRGA